MTELARFGNDEQRVADLQAHAVGQQIASTRDWIGRQQRRFGIAFMREG